MSKHTPGPWRYEAGGGHAYNRIVGSGDVQTNGWPEPINGISNASYSDRVCENLGDISLPGPAANAKLIAAAPELLEAAKRALNYCINSQREVGIADESDEELDSTKLLRAAIAKATT